MTTSHFESAYSVGDAVVVDEPTPAPVFNDVMIDIETMSLHKHKALVLSVGLIEFDPAPLSGLVIGKQLLVIPELKRQLLMGRRVDQGTQEFWRKQPKEASAHWMFPKDGYEYLEKTFELITAFCAGKQRVWANGNQFDLANLEGLADDIGVTNLWHYQAPRDMRTFTRETPATRMVPMNEALDIPGVLHEPVYDCIAQAWQVWAHYQDKP